ncbi:endothelial cell-specific chemotaxis regulator isoform X2 [Dromiciops gliroides]|uniref:endothelial cell-specific chemotaxis regulator isoform X2 n=1 Tax=Dromiciops gliroides TaxID=33562 RepID=UPI001CC4520A|nr:endothelial cell-specific chemotaxis regulator isoform X2 [Dromiciops gliroides]
MSTIRAQLCLGILSYILFQGNEPSTFTAHSSPQSTTDIPESLRMSTLVTTTRGESSSPRSSTFRSLLQSSPFGPTTKTQTQRATSGQGTSALSYKIRDRSQMPTSAVTTSDISSKSTTMDLRTTEKPVFPTPTSETVLTVAAFGVITFIVILVVVVIILVSVVSLRFKCQKNKESEDPQKPDSSGMSESSTAIREKDNSITLIYMKNINSNNNKRSLTEEKVL